MNVDKFKQLFRFNPKRAFYVGVERECFLCDSSGKIAPLAMTLLESLADPRFGYELSACQLEERIGPCSVDEVKNRLDENQVLVEAALQKLGISRSFNEVGPKDMPLDVYPDPTGRYAEISKNMPHHILLAASRVIGTHVHVGMPDSATALDVYNRVVHDIPKLIELGNGSFGERLAIYRIVAPKCDPKPYRSWNMFYSSAKENGFDEDPRKCWTLIRISAHGTIEFRMFGSTESNERVAYWAQYCRDICLSAAAGAKENAQMDYCGW